MNAPGVRHRRPSAAADRRGFPLAPVVIGLVGAALIGLLLASALEGSTDSVDQQAAAPIQADDAPGKNASGLPVVTESTLGLEVERLIESGTLQAPANFDVNACMVEQGIDDPVLMMEEIEWGPDSGENWLIVHGPTGQESLQNGGGIVYATVVTPTCGTPESEGVEQTRLWTGSTLIGSI